MGFAHPYGIKAESLYRNDGNGWLDVRTRRCMLARVCVYMLAVDGNAGGLMAGLIFLEKFSEIACIFGLRC
jgi:hypothetical protein